MAARRPPPISAENVMSDEDFALVHPEMDRLVRENEARTQRPAEPDIQASRSAPKPSPEKVEAPPPREAVRSAAPEPSAPVAPTRPVPVPVAPMPQSHRAEAPRVHSPIPEPSATAVPPVAPTVQPKTEWQDLSHEMARRGAEPRPPAQPPVPPRQAEVHREEAHVAAPPASPQPKRRISRPVQSGERMFVQLRLAQPVAKMFRAVAEKFGLDYNAAGAMLLTFGYEALSRQEMVPPKAALS